MAVKRRLGDNSWLAIAPQTDQDTPKTMAADFVQNRFPFTSMGLSPDVEFLRSEAIRGRRSNVKGRPGKFSGNGAIETELYIARMGDFWRGILNSGAPTASVVADKTLSTVATFAATMTLDASVAAEQPNVPSQIKVDLTAFASATGDVVVHGRRRVDLGSSNSSFVSMEETITLATKEATTSKYFAEVTELDLSGVTGPTPGDTTDTVITAEPNSMESTYANSDEVFPGWTVQQSIGNVPQLVETAIPNSTTLTIGDSVRLAMEMLALNVIPYTEINNSAGALAFGAAGTQGGMLNALDFITEEFFPNWGGYLEADGNALLFTNLVINVNQNLDFLPGINGKRSQIEIGPSAGAGVRDVTVTPTVYYEVGDATDTFTRWETVFSDNNDVPLDVLLYYWKDDGKQISQKVSFPKSSLTAYPGPSVDARGPITRDLAFQATPDSSTAPDEIEVVITA